MSNRKRRRQNAYRDQDGKCYFCDCEMRLVETCRGKLGDDVATLYHLDCRYDVDRGTYPEHVERTVLACAACSRAVSRERQALVPIEELHRRAKRHPSRRKPAARREVVPDLSGLNVKARVNRFQISQEQLVAGLKARISENVE